MPGLAEYLQGNGAYPQPLGGPAPLPDVRPREMRQSPLGQSNLVDRALSSFGQPSLDALRRGYAGEATPQEVARTFLETGPVGPFGAVRVPNPIRAYHGSPHDFDEFRLDKIGTGEGAQAYGHGIYVAENPNVAATYRTAGTGQIPAYSRSGDLDEMLVRRNGDINRVIDDIRKELLRFEESKYRGSPNHQGWQSYLDLAERYRRGDPELLPLPENAPGRMYEVNLHARPEQFLDWDRPLARQSESTRQAIEQAGLWPHSARDPLGNPGYGVMTNETARRFAGPSGRVEPNPGDMSVHHFSNWTGTRPLQEAGIPGIRYLDQGSRTGSSIGRLDGQPVASNDYTSHLAISSLTDNGSPQEALAFLRRSAQGARYPDEALRATQAAQLIADGRISLDPRAATSNFVVFSPEIIEILRKYGIAGPVAAPAIATGLSDYLQNPQN